MARGKSVMHADAMHQFWHGKVSWSSKNQFQHTKLHHCSYISLLSLRHILAVWLPKTAILALIFQHRVSISRHKSYWQYKDKKNFYFLQYEDIKKDRRTTIKKLAAFLDKDLQDHHLDNIEKLTSFDAMKNNPSTNYSTSKNLWAHSYPKEMQVKLGIFGQNRGYFGQPILEYHLGSTIWVHVNFVTWSLQKTLFHYFWCFYHSSKRIEYFISAKLQYIQIPLKATNTPPNKQFCLLVKIVWKDQLSFVVAYQNHI